MLPILRLISVGGVFLAITILGLALIPPSRSSMQWAAGDLPARGALIDRMTHPEWRQFLILAALRRAGELDQLRSLPENSNVASGESSIGGPERAPNATADKGTKFAGLPAAPDEAGPVENTGSINVAPSATMQIDIGETSSFELPVGPVEETPPVTRSPAIGMTETSGGETALPTVAAPDLPDTTSPSVAASPPAQTKPVVVIHKRSVHRGSAKPPAAKATESSVMLPPPFNILQAIFASLSGSQNATAEPPPRPAIKHRPTVMRKRTANAE